MLLPKARPHHVVHKSWQVCTILCLKYQLNEQECLPPFLQNCAPGRSGSHQKIFRPQLVSSCQYPSCNWRFSQSALSDISTVQWSKNLFRLVTANFSWLSLIGAADMSGFRDLPPELVIKVASFLEKDDLCSLRLTSRYVEQHAIDYWATACFDKVFILPTKHALDRLREVSKHEKVRKAIRWMYIISTVYGRNDEDHSWDRYAPMILPCEKEGTEHELPYPNPAKICMDYANDNIIILRWGEFERLLRDAITALSPLAFWSVGTNTNLHKGHMWWGRSELIEKAGKEPCSTMNSGSKLCFACPSIQTRVCSMRPDPRLQFALVTCKHLLSKSKWGTA